VAAQLGGEGCFVRPKSNRRTESQIRKSRKRIMHACPTPRVPRRKYIQKVFALIEVVIVFVAIAFLLAATVPGFLHARKRPQALKIPSGLRTADPALDPIANSRATRARLQILTGLNT
jgi:hypothetical protein